ncbi:hypothetical protein [Terrabacter sp. NPDC080008]|uniref:hypothetical protein n=1 Tax=Terrabacter sp. NPDC080008 TaxID=3155176 RepID=UPI00344DE025
MVGHRFVHPRALDEVHGLRVTALADTWVDLGELVGRGKPMGLDDLIILGDACATKLRAVGPLRVALSRRIRPRGKRTLVEALRVVRVGSISPMETLVRIIFVRAGLPEPLPNEPVFASDGSGRLLGFGDLVWLVERRGKPPIKVIGEYQGEQFHSSQEQRDHDGERREQFEDDDGWTVQEIWRSDMTGNRARRELVEKLAWYLQVPSELLHLGDVEPRFFSEYAVELAIQRGMRR